MPNVTGSIVKADMVAAWQHRVAVRVAPRVRSARLRRSTREELEVERISAPPLPDPAWAELSRVLDEEVAKLPTRHRTAFVLCCLEGKTGEEAAQLLGCPPGKVSSRLTRARERLRERLTRRGFAPAVLAIALAGDAFATVPCIRLVGSTLTAALAFTSGFILGGLGLQPAAIAEGVLRVMILTKLRLAALFLVAGLLAVGAVLAGTDLGSAPDQPLWAKANDRKDAAGGPTVEPSGLKGPPPAKAGDDEGSLKKTMLENARKVFDLDLERYRVAGGPIPVEELYRWSVRWLEAELDLAADATMKTAALIGHVDRMKGLEKMATNFANAGQGRERDAVASRYYRAEAELWVTRGRTK